MDLRTTIASAITVGVIGTAAALAWTERRIKGDRDMEIRRTVQRVDSTWSPLDGDPPDSNWLSEPNAIVLKLDASLSTERLTLIEDRHNYRRDLERPSAVLLERADRTHVFVLAAGDGFESSALEFTIPATAQAGQKLHGKFGSMSCFGPLRSPQIHGSLTLSALPSRVGDELHFELHASVSPNWRYDAAGPVSVRRESD